MKRLFGSGKKMAPVEQDYDEREVYSYENGEYDDIEGDSWEEGEYGPSEEYLEEEGEYEPSEGYLEEEGECGPSEEYLEEEGEYEPSEEYLRNEIYGAEDEYSQMEIVYRDPEEERQYSNGEEYPEEEITYSGEAEYLEEELEYDGEAEYPEAEPEYEGEAEYLEEELEYDGEAGYPEAEPEYDGEVEYPEEELEYNGEAEYSEMDAKYDSQGYPGEDSYYADERVYEGLEETCDAIGEEEPDEELYYEEEYYEGETPKKSTKQHSKSAPNRSGSHSRTNKPGLLTKLTAAVYGMDVMDRIMVIVSVIVLILAIVTIAVFISTRVKGSQVSAFSEVGSQLEGIEVIGGQGLAAVADAEIARISAASVTPEPTAVPEEPPKEYDEVDYKRQVAVEPDFTSIQKDLKIKFINQKTDKLVPNVPFSVTVTDPDGKSYIWSDDDMDGIIHKKDIKPGTYKVTMESLTDTKYSSYTIAAATKTVEVKEEIVYKKVDVENEVKQEAEVNVAKEDTKKNETVVESTLQDTLPWVESKVIGSGYSEVAKSAIPDPLTIALSTKTLSMNRAGAGRTSLWETLYSASSSAFQVMGAENGVPTLTAAVGADSAAQPGQEARMSLAATETKMPSEESVASSAVEMEPLVGDPVQELTSAPAVQTELPVTDPSQESAADPTVESTADPAADPTAEPTADPTVDPTADPTVEPTAEPTMDPTLPPIMDSTAPPAVDPTADPATPAPTQPPAETQEPAADPTASPIPEPSASPGPAPSASPSPAPSASPSPAPSASPSPEPSVSPSPTPVPKKGKLSLDKTVLSGIVGASLAAKATASEFTEGSKIVYSVSSSASAVAEASIDGEGNISVKGVAAGTAVLTVTANYEDGTDETKAEATISVAVGDSKTLVVDQTSVTIFATLNVTVNAVVANALSQNPTVTAESSDVKIATVAVDKTAVTITGIAEGSAVITVKYEENGEEVSAVCTVTVKRHPMDDKTTTLKTSDGQQVYVEEGGSYREAVQADYYTAAKFYVKAEVKYTGWQTLGGKVYYFTADCNKVTGEQVIQGAKYHFASDGSLVTDNGTLGIDVSKWNGTIDWNAVKNSGVSYVIIRCGYRGSSTGNLIVDPKFEANIKGATAVGLKVGIYFFSQATSEVEAVEEASMVLGQIKNYTISYPVFIDVEASGGRGDAIDKATRTAVCRAFCQTIQSGNYTAGIYSNKTWLEERLDASSLSAYKIWLAQYATAPTYTGRYDMWQYRANGSVSGISGNVDMNISYLGY